MCGQEYKKFFKRCTNAIHRIIIPLHETLLRVEGKNSNGTAKLGCCELRVKIPMGQQS